MLNNKTNLVKFSIQKKGFAHMKKNLLAASFLAAMTLCYPQDGSKEFNKTFLINGRTVIVKVKLNSITEYDENGNRIHVKDFRVPMEFWMKYDKNGNEIYLKKSNGYESWHKYDLKGRMISFKDTLGVKIQRKYNASGSILHYKSPLDEHWTEFNSAGQKVYNKRLKRFSKSKKPQYNEKWFYYDEQGNLTSTRDSLGYESSYKYDANNNKIYEKLEDGTEFFYEYDENGNQIYRKSSTGFEAWFEYDKKGNVIYEKFSDTSENFYEYDLKGNLRYYKAVRNKEIESEVYCEYELYSDGKVKTATFYNGV